MNEFTMDYIVDFRDVDRYFDLKAESLMQILGTISMNHEVLGYRLKPGYMMEWGMAWILYQWKIQMFEPKQYAHKIHARTTVLLKRDMYCYRYYLLEDGQGKIIGKAVAQWVAVDMEKRRIGRIPAPIAKIITQNGDLTREQEKELLDIDVAPIRKKEGPFDFELRIPVLYSDIDSNQHVTNAIYGRWATETLHAMDPGFLERNYHEKVDVVYKKEKQAGGFVLSKVRLEGSTSYHEIWDEEGCLLTLLELGWTEKARHNGDYSDYDFASVMG